MYKNQEDHLAILRNFMQYYVISRNIMQSKLLPRRQEILEIIKDHPYITLDSIARRFPKTPKRTISYDVNQLVKKKLVNKHGQTRGVLYTTQNQPKLA